MVFHYAHPNLSADLRGATRREKVKRRTLGIFNSHGSCNIQSDQTVLTVDENTCQSTRPSQCNCPLKTEFRSYNPNTWISDAFIV